jgi:hypothetical protein
VASLLNTRANSSTYYYTSRLPAAPAEGVAGIQVHPLEPVSSVLKITALL